PPPAGWPYGGRVILRPRRPGGWKVLSMLSVGAGSGPIFIQYNACSAEFSKLASVEVPWYSGKGVPGTKAEQPTTASGYPRGRNPTGERERPPDGMGMARRGFAHRLSDSTVGSRSLGCGFPIPIIASPTCPKPTVLVRSRPSL